MLDQNATIGDAMYFFEGHELTHVAEQSGTYNDLATALLRIEYGDEIGDFQEFLKKVESGEMV